MRPSTKVNHSLNTIKFDGKIARRNLLFKKNNKKLHLGLYEYPEDENDIVDKEMSKWEYSINSEGYHLGGPPFTHTATVPFVIFQSLA